MEQLEQVGILVERDQGRNRGVAKARIGHRHDAGKIVVTEQRRFDKRTYNPDHRVRIGEAVKRCDMGGFKLRPFSRHKQPAITRQAAQKHAFKRLLG